MIDELKRRFFENWREIGARTDARMCEIAWDSLAQLYSGPGRYYHTLAHVEDCLMELDGVMHLARNPRALKSGMMYHDIIYNTREGGNEEMSKAFMTGTLSAAGVCSCIIEDSGKVIMATDINSQARELDEMLAADIDLSSLGKSPERFDRYSRNIRKEFSWVNPDEYASGRIAVLETILKRNSTEIYYTDIFRQKYTKQAIENIERAIVNLKEGKF